MKLINRLLAFILMAFLLSSCSWIFSGGPELDEDEVKAAQKTGLELDYVRELKSKPIYEFTPNEVDKFIGYMQNYKPDLRERIEYIAKKNVGQPYKLVMMGEFPFELYDQDDIFCIEYGNCVIYSEHTYAMALTDNWKTFMAMLQRIRYKNGEIGNLTRNHYTSADWDVNNSWLFEDITKELVGDKAAKTVIKIDRKKFFGRKGIETDIPVQNYEFEYIPHTEVMNAVKNLKTGDFVNVVRGHSADGVWVGHVGMICVDPDGTVNFMHSTPPEAKVQTIESYMEQQLAREDVNFYGFKFLRLRENAWENLRKIDGPRAPKVTVYGTNN